MLYRGKGKGQNKRRGDILSGLCGLFLVLAVIWLENVWKLRGDIRELNGKQLGQLDGETAEAAVIRVAQTDINGAPGSGSVGFLPKDAWESSQESYPDKCGLENVESPEKRSRQEVRERLRELGEESEEIADILGNASNYPDKLLEALANNPEMADFASRWDGLKQAAAGGLTDREKEEDFPLFLQWDPRWGYVEYGDKSCIGLSGCGPTCLSMALYYLTGDEAITPDKVGEYSMENGCYISGVGTAWALMEDMPEEYGIQVRQHKASEKQLKEALDDGAVVILSMGPGYFTAAGHFIVVYGYDDEGFLVNDPNCVARSRMKWSYSGLKGQIKNMWVFTKGNTVY